MPAQCKLAKGFTGLNEYRGLARGGLIAPNDHVDIERIKLNSAADAFCLVRRR